MTKLPAVPQTRSRPMGTYVVLDSSQTLRSVRMDRLHQIEMTHRSRERRSYRQIATALAMAMQAAKITKR